MSTKKVLADKQLITELKERIKELEEQYESIRSESGRSREKLEELGERVSQSEGSRKQEDKRFAKKGKVVSLRDSLDKLGIRLDSLEQSLGKKYKELRKRENKTRETVNGIMNDLDI